MNLVDLAEIWALQNNKTNPTEIVTDGITIDNRIDSELLANLIFQYCGAMTPIYNVTTSFIWANRNFFKTWYWQIGQLLDTLEYNYEPLENFRRDENLNKGTSENTDTTRSENETLENNKEQTIDDTTGTTKTSNITDSGTVTDTGDIKDSGTISNTGNVKDTGTVSDMGNVKNSGTVQNTGTVKDSGAIQNTGTVKDEEVKTVESNKITELKTSAYNESVYQPESQTTETLNTSESNSNNRTNNLTETTDMVKTNNLTETTDMTKTNNLTQTTDMTKTNNLTETTDMTKTNNLIKTTDMSNDEETLLNEKYNSSKTNTENNLRTLGVNRNEARTYGSVEKNNIRGLNGLYTTQNLINQQREVVQFNIYMWIVDKYKDTMMYGVFC